MSSLKTRTPISVSKAMFVGEVGPRSRTQVFCSPLLPRLRINSPKPMQVRLVRGADLPPSSGLDWEPPAPRNHRIKLLSEELTLPSLYLIYYLKRNPADRSWRCSL